MRSMKPGEVVAFVARNSFGVLSVADANHAYGVPLFYGTDKGLVYFQTRQGLKTRYLYRTMEACLTVTRFHDETEWASAQILGRLERVDEVGPAAQRALARVPPPLAWSPEDVRAEEDDRDGLTTFRLGTSWQIGRYTNPEIIRAGAREFTFSGM